MSGNLEYHKRLYLGKSITQSKLVKIKKQIESKPLFSNMYLITISRNPNDQLEIFRAKQLNQKYYSKYPVYVIGLSSNYEEALEIIEQIVQECLQTRGDCALKEYLLC